MIFPFFLDRQRENLLIGALQKGGVPHVHRTIPRGTKEKEKQMVPPKNSKATSQFIPSIKSNYVQFSMSSGSLDHSKQD